MMNEKKTTKLHQIFQRSIVKCSKITMKKSPPMLHTRFYLMRFIFIKFIRLLFFCFTCFISFRLIAMYTYASSHRFFPLSQCSFWALFHSMCFMCSGFVCVSLILQQFGAELPTQQDDEHNCFCFVHEFCETDTVGWLVAGRQAMI